MSARTLDRLMGAVAATLAVLLLVTVAVVAIGQDFS